METALDRKRRKDFERARALSSEFKKREKWSRRVLLLRFQKQQLDRLVRYAVAHSSFYRDLYN